MSKPPQGWNADELPNDAWNAEVARRDAELQTGGPAAIKLGEPETGRIRAATAPQSDNISWQIAMRSVRRALPRYSDADCCLVLHQAAASGGISLTLPDRRVPPAEYWAALQFDSRGFAFVGPDGAIRHRAGDLEVSRLRLDAGLAQARTDLKSWPGERVQPMPTAELWGKAPVVGSRPAQAEAAPDNWASRVKAAGSLYAALIAWGKPQFTAGLSPSRSELLARHRNQFGPLPGVSEDTMRDLRKDLASDEDKRGGAPRHRQRPKIPG